MMRIVDTKGQICPKPIIETKKVLKEVAVGETFKVITDNETSFNNLRKFLNDNHTDYHISEKNGIWSLEVTKLAGEIKIDQPEKYCAASETNLTKGDYAIVISSDRMGQGDDELGRRLMKSFIGIIQYLDEIPEAIVFYNSGVKLTTSDSDVIESLHELEKQNVEIMICGTCVDFYGIRKQLGTGKIYDMLVINNRLLKTGKVIRP
jgi:selenium metabolism protein YedF